MKKRKDGYYKLTKVINGKQKSFYGKTREECRKKLNEFVKKKDSVLFRDVADEWWEHHSSNLAYNSTKPLRPAYIRAKESFGDMSVTEILPSDISKYISEFVSKGYADKTTRTQLGAFRMIFSYAINYKGINILNPARDIAIPRNLPKTKVSMPSDEDIQKVKDSVGEPFGLFAYMLMYTGMRKSELLALRWEDIQDGYIRVSKSLYYVSTVPHLKEPKTESGVRRIPVLDKLAPYLNGSKGIVFDEDGHYMRPHIFMKRWNEYKQVTGISCTPHQLRHCFSTMLYEANVSAKDAQYLLGHAQVSTTMDIYTDIRKQRERNIRESIKNIDISTYGVENRV